jgi:hypothetical protein
MSGASARRIGAATLLVVATLLWTAGTIGVWAKRQALDTDNWVATSTRLLQNDRVRDALAAALVDRLYDTSAVEARLREALPPRLDPLAAPAASGLREVALRNAPRVLGSAAALTAWREANRTASRTLLAIVEGRVAAGGDVSLNVRDLLGQVAARTGLPAGAADRLPPSVATVEVLRSDQVKTAQDAVRLFRDGLWVLAALAILCFAGAIALGVDRRRRVLSVGVSLVISAVAVLAIRRVAGTWLTGQLADAPNSQAVAGDVWTIATSLLVEAAEGTALVGLLVVLGAWIAGPGRVATSARRTSSPILRNHASAVRAGLAVVLLLLVWWGPVPWTNEIIPVLLLSAAAFAWLEWLRHRTLDEFPDDSAHAHGLALEH